MNVFLSFMSLAVFHSYTYLSSKELASDKLHKLFSSDKAVLCTCPSSSSPLGVAFLKQLVSNQRICHVMKQRKDKEGLTHQFDVC